jgi:hypothetical protein
VDILKTIAPIFIIIAFGYVLKNRKMLSDVFISEANRFVFLFPLPFLIFTGIIKADMKGMGWLSVLSLIIPTAIVMALAVLSAAAATGAADGNFIQATFHGKGLCPALPSSSLLVMKGRREPPRRYDPLQQRGASALSLSSGTPQRMRTAPHPQNTGHHCHLRALPRFLKVTIEAPSS